MDDKRNQRVFEMAFASVHPHYVHNAEGKGTKKEVDEGVVGP